MTPERIHAPMVAWSLGPQESEAYATDVALAYFRAVPVEAARKLRVRPGERVLDAACGAGIVATEAAARGARALALDLSAPMLREASRLTGAQRVGWLQADIHAIPLRDATFDAVACPHGLMFFDHPERGLAELARVLRPGGRMVATTWSDGDANPHELALAAAFELEGVARPPFFDLLFSLADRRDVAALAASAGLTDVRVERMRGVAHFDSAASYWRGLTSGRPIGRLLDALPPETSARIRRASLSNMRPFAHQRGFRSPMESIFLVARKPGVA